VLVDHEPVVGAVYRVVQHCAVEADLDVLHLAERPVQRERVADLGGHGSADAFFLAAFCDGRPVRVAERDPHGDARTALVGQDPQDSGVLSEEQRTVGQDGDLLLGRPEQPRPYLPRYGPPVRVNRPQLVGPAPRRQRPARIRPQVGFVPADQIGDRSPVVRVGNAPVQLPPDRLGVDAQPGGNVVFAKPRPQQRLT
jgi:hypothetical protein